MAFSTLHHVGPRLVVKSGTKPSDHGIPFRRCFIFQNKPSTMRSLFLYLVHPLCLTSLGSVEAFAPSHDSSRNHRRHDGSMSQSSEVEQEITATATSTLDPKEAEKFKVLTCMSTSCCQKRKALGLDSLATFGAMYSRIQGGNAPMVRLEEAACLGACKKAPCVAVEHDDFVGTVSLLGMTDDEFSSRV
jgi:hypothetical protein